MSAFNSSAAPALRRFDAQRDAVVALARAGHLHAEPELDALSREDALERLGDLGIHRGHDAVEELHHRHLRAQPPPNAAELKADIAAADHHQMAGNLVEFQAAGGGDDLLLIHLDAGERHALGSGGDDDVLRVVAGAIDIDLAGRGDAAGALEPGHLVLAEQEFHALHIGGHHLGLACLHAGEVQLHGVNQHAVVLQRVSGVVEFLGRLQQAPWTGCSRC